ncbi:SRPBCC domain-containing protein [Streptomyces sp. NPDC059698]|uniref:SRPBCC domain-containing protein n=1 Tax=unclassified Streptomyces TaxID=2593676 RepID=UPI00093EC5DD|nr:SRPBCC domain-containing protein [Streptomyces sp. CB02366]OKJ38619.1 carbon monoxide dehydrogenase [Streptomyces sp. CB02366]
MEHEVFVPVPVPTLLRTLGDPARVARCVPGFQQDADASASPLAGRLKLRAGGHTITYRGELRLTGPEDGDGPDGPRFSVTGEGVEARGDGGVELILTVALTGTDGGTTLVYSGTAEGDGRLAEWEEGAALAAAHRLLDRFTQQLVTESLASREEGEDVDGGGETGGGASAGPGEAPAEAEAGDSGEARADADADAEVGGNDDDRADDRPRSVYDSPVPPPSLDPVAGVEFSVPEAPPAEAAHARRTMIGRSAEEVDHAPPRGRYAPVPSQDAGGANTALRWVAPAAALVLASAVVLGRAWRRRR